MSAGLGENRELRAGATWLDRRDPPHGGRPEVPALRQDMSALPALIDLGVAEFSALVQAGRIDPRTEHVLCHYSAEHFRAKLFARLREAGYEPGDHSWFTNLHTAGNTGAASIFVMLDAARPRLRPGDRVLLIVPESGRFSLAFAQLTCVASGQGAVQPPSPAELAASPLGHPEATDTPAAARAFTELAGVWAEFQRVLDRRNSAMADPSLWEVMAVDPSIPVDQATMRLMIRDQRSRSRALLYPWVRILSRVDIQTALGLMNIPFALCLTPGEYRRAVHSMRLDTSLLTVLAALTGDSAFLGWRPPSLPVRVDSNVDVPQMVYEHAVICECAHARLRWLRDIEDKRHGTIKACSTGGDLR